MPSSFFFPSLSCQLTAAFVTIEPCTLIDLGSLSPLLQPRTTQVLTSVYSISVPLRPFSRLRNHILVVPSVEYGPYPRVTLSLVHQTPTRKTPPRGCKQGSGFFSRCGHQYQEFGLACLFFSFLQEWWWVLPRSRPTSRNFSGFPQPRRRDQHRMHTYASGFTPQRLA